MNPSYVRSMVAQLLADLRANPQLGRRRSLVGRYVRPVGLSLAIGIGGASACGRGSMDTTDGAQEMPRQSDAVPSAGDVYAMTSDGLLTPPDTADALPPNADIYGASDRPPLRADTADVLPLPADAYGIVADVPDLRDTRDALPGAVDIYGIGEPPATTDTRDVLPPPADAYAMSGDRPPAPVDTRDVLPPPGDLYGIAPIDAGALDAERTG